VTRSLLRSLIRETLLTEEVYGAQAVVYHGTEADPEQLVSALLNDKFTPGRGAGSMYGKGLYTVYDLKGTQTERGTYGRHIIKLKLNLYGYIIFDPDVALRVYKAPLSVVEQAEEIGLDEDLVEKLRGVATSQRKITSTAAEIASNFLKGRVKGLVFTGRNDGRVAVVYDPTTAVPIAWKVVRSKSWTPVDRESIRPALRRSASGDWEEEKYETSPLRVVEKLKKLPIDQRVVSGDLNPSFTPITSLPSGLKVGGTLNLNNTPIASLPDGLKVGGHLILRGTRITSLPPGLQVGGDIDAYSTPIASLPPGLQVGGNLNLSLAPIKSLPDGLRVGGTLGLSNTRITSLPVGLRVGGNLDLNGTPITSLPDRLQVGGSLSLYGTPIAALPPDLQVDGSIHGFKGDLSQVPTHIRSKIT
jgi:hypothetical protein